MKPAKPQPVRAEFFVEGRPFPKARARVTRYGSYTPDSTASWQDDVRTFYRNQCRGIFFEKEIALIFYAEVICPGRGPIHSISGDWDNYGKAIADALNHVAYHDDSQIVDGRTVKRRRRKGEQLGAFVCIEVKND